MDREKSLALTLADIIVPILLGTMIAIALFIIGVGTTQEDPPPSNIFQQEVYKIFGEEAKIRPVSRSRFYVLDENNELWYIDFRFSYSDGVIVEQKYKSFEIEEAMR